MVDIGGGRPPRTHGTGEFTRERFRSVGKRVIIEPGVLVFHPETIDLGDDVYVGHNAILKGYHRNRMIIGSGTWIGQGAFFHSAGGLTIGSAVGVGPFAKILTSMHQDGDIDMPVLHHPLKFAEVVVEAGADLGVGAILLPGVTVGEGAIVGAGSVVTRDVPAYAVVAGIPARLLRTRGEV